eukprot:Sspe_Gene.63153::Locus_35916_Transcript_1_1_Confidence_1.000_Length_5776::g.63153::m.63153
MLQALLLLLSLLLLAPSNAYSSEMDCPKVVGVPCRNDTFGRLWHTSCSPSSNCALCGFCPTCTGPNHCAVCKRGYQLLVGSEKTCTGRCVPEEISIPPPTCQPMCRCEDVQGDVHYSASRHLLQTGGVFPNGTAFFNGSTNASTPVPWNFTTGNSTATPVPWSPPASKSNLNCTTEHMTPMRTYNRGYSCWDWNLPNDSYCAQDYSVYSECRELEGAPGLICVRCKTAEEILQEEQETPHPIGSGGSDLVEGHCPVKGYETFPNGQECNPCRANLSSTTILCGESGCSEANQCHFKETVTLPVGETKYFVFNSVSSPERAIQVRKVAVRGKARFAVQIAGRPKIDENQQSTPDVKTWNCRSRGDGSGTEACEIPGCGPFAVALLASGGPAEVNLSVCYNYTECTCSRAAADGKVHGECVMNAGGDIRCECDSSPDKGYFGGATGQECTKCQPGYFPSPGPNTTNPCTLRCKNGGLYNETTEKCMCGNYEGDLCEICNMAGKYCNETFPFLLYTFQREFTFSQPTLSPPPWKIAPNSQLKVTLTTETPGVVLSDVLETFKLTSKSYLNDPEANIRPTVPEPTRYVSAAYYGPTPGAHSSYTSKKFLHVFVEDQVYIYDPDKYEANLRQGKREFGTPTVKKTVDYYESVGFKSCKENFNDDPEYDRNFDAVLFIQDHAVHVPGYSSSQAVKGKNFATDDWLVFVKGGNICWVTGNSYFGATWSVSSNSKYTGWNRLTDFFFVKDMGSMWLEGQEQLNFNDIVKNETIAMVENKANMMRAGFKNTAACKTKQGKAPAVNPECLVGERDSWDTMVVLGNNLVMIRGDTVRTVSIPDMLCCQFLPVDEFCGRECTYMRTTGDLNSWEAFRSKSNGTATELLINSIIQQTSFSSIFPSLSRKGRITAIANGTLATGISSLSQTADDFGGGSYAGGSGYYDPYQDPYAGGGSAGGYSPGPGESSYTGGTSGGGGGSSGFVSTAWSTVIESPPLLIFEDQRLWLRDDRLLPFEELPIAKVLPRLGFPVTLQISAATNKPRVVKASELSLAFVLELFDDLNNPVHVNDYVYPELLSCGEDLTEEAKSCLDTLEPWALQEVSIADALKEADDCTPVVDDSRVVGGGVIWMEAGAFTFERMGINREGRYKIKFVHAKSELSVTTPVITVLSADCDDENISEESDQCFRDCTDSAVNNPGSTPATSYECRLDFDSSKNYVKLEVKISGFAMVEVKVEGQQPCCKGKGLCCVGNKACYADEDEGAVYTDVPHCTCIEDPSKGMYDQRHDCDKCKEGYIQMCKTENLDTSIAQLAFAKDDKNGAVPLQAGTRNFHLVRPQMETAAMVSVSHKDENSDIDIAVAFVSCPGQDKVLGKSALAPREIAVPCTGQGECLFNATTGKTECKCELGFHSADCSSACCSGHGTCEQATGTKCQCLAQSETGYWGSVHDTTNTSVVDHANFVLANDTDSTSHINDTVMTAGQGEPLRFYMSWRGLQAPSKDSVSHAKIVLTEADGGRCKNSQRIYVYATQPKDITAPKTDPTALCSLNPPIPSMCTSPCCTVDEPPMGAPSCVDAPYTDHPYLLGCGSKAPCNVLIPTVNRSRITCPESSTLVTSQTDTNYGMCKCESGFFCNVMGLCSSVSPCGSKSDLGCGVNTKNIGGICTCETTQLDSDSLEHSVCEDGSCVTPVYRLQYTWKADEVNATSIREHKELQHAMTTSNARFRFEVASYLQRTQSKDGKTVEIDITAWLVRHTQYLNTKLSSLMDLSFVIVAEPADDQACQPAVYSAAAEAAKRPKLVVKSKGNHQPSRLFLGIEHSRRSDLQAGHPYYRLYTVDNLQGLGQIGTPTSTNSRDIQRYSGDSVSRPAKDGSCGGSSCKCPQEVAFQDPTDFVQI